MITIRNTEVRERDLDSFKKYNEYESIKLFFAKADWNIDRILYGLSHETIQDSHIRGAVRRFLFAKKYGILPQYDSYHGVGLSHVGHVSDDCVIIQCEDTNTSMVLSPQGVIKVPEGHIHINPNSFNCNGFNAWSPQGEKSFFGLYSKAGDEILPCIFEGLDNSSGHTPSAQYKGLKFKFHVYYYPKIVYHGTNKYNSWFSFPDGVIKLDSRCNRFSNKDEEENKTDEEIVQITEELYSLLSQTHHRCSDMELEELLSHE